MSERPASAVNPMLRNEISLLLLRCHQKSQTTAIRGESRARHHRDAAARAGAGQAVLGSSEGQVCPSHSHLICGG